jgi:RNA polymerase sigma-70 factor (ECF subfamily)
MVPGKQINLPVFEEGESRRTMSSKKTETQRDLEKWHKGKREALELLLERNLPWIHARVRQRLGPKLRRMVDSIDVVQDAAVQFLLYAPRFLVSDERHFRALLARIVENVLRNKNDWYTARRRELARMKPLPSDTMLILDPPRDSKAATPSSLAQAQEEEAWIRFCIELLEPNDREVLVLRQWDGLSFVEIGERLGLSESAAWMRHSRALGRLAKSVGALRRGELEQVVEGFLPQEETDE